MQGNLIEEIDCPSGKHFQEMPFFMDLRIVLFLLVTLNTVRSCCVCICLLQTFQSAILELDGSKKCVQTD